MLASKNTSDFKGIPVAEAMKWLQTSEKGLSEAEAAERAKEYGFNEIIPKEKSALADFLSRFWGPIPWLLEVAAVLSCLVGEIFDGGLIFLLLLMNTVIGFVEEQKSHKALELLKKKMKIKAQALRDGKWVTKESRELVPGDIILVGLGDLVPADVKIISGNISADQSALSGESLPVNLKDGEVTYNGAIVKRGEARCIVVGTGKNTYFGKTVELVNIAKPKSRQQAVMLDISKYMIYLGAIIYIVVLWHGLEIGSGMLVLMTFAVLFIGGGVPAALPVMFTVSQATGAGELAEKGILVTRLDSIENAASVEVLCLDKTGTITKNELEVSEIIPFGKFREEDVALYAGLASTEGSKDMIDATVLGYAKGKVSGALGKYKSVSFVPFEPATKRTEAVVELGGKRIKAMKGAPQILLSMCKKSDRKTVALADKKIEELSLKGCRALAVARSTNPKMNEFELVGMLALADPIRPDTSAMISDMRAAGIRPMMITGDNIAVAKEIASQASIGNMIAKISELKSLGEQKMKEAIGKLDGIAEIYPEDKFSIVKLWQSRGMMVGMTGDGVNDAPALKQAEMGVAVSNSTDVAKAAASIVLTEPGTRLIIEAVKTSRQIYQRMLTWAINKISKSIQFLGIATVGFFWFEGVVISITGLMLIVFVNDFLTLTLAKDNARSTSNPNKWNVKNLSIASGFLGVLFMLQGVFLMWIGKDYFHLTFEEIQTLILLLFAYTSMFRILIVRERGHCWDSMPSKAVILTTLLTVAVFTYLSIEGILLKELPANMVYFTLAFCIIVTFLMDVPKYYVFRRLGL